MGVVSWADYDTSMQLAIVSKNFTIQTAVSITLSLRQKFQQQPMTGKKNTNSWILQVSKGHTAKKDSVNHIRENRETETNITCIIDTWREQGQVHI